MKKGQRIWEKVDTALLKVLGWVVALFVVGLTLANLIVIRHVDGEYGEQGYFEWLNPLPILGAILMIGLLFGFMKTRLFRKTSARTLLNILLIYAAGMSVLLYGLWGAKVQSDSLDLENVMLGNGDVGYLENCPQQLGYLLVMKLVGRLFMNHAMGYLMMNIPFLLLTLWSLVMITRRIFEDTKIEKMVTLLLFGFLPLLTLPIFAYNDMMALGLTTFAIWMALEMRRSELAQKQRWQRLVLMSVSMGAAVVLRQNALIALIALIIYLIFTTRKTSIKLSLIGIAAVIIVALGGQWAVKAFYTVRSDRDFLSGKEAFPAAAYLAMGMGIEDTWSGEPVPRRPWNAAGWYNAYPTNCMYYLGKDGCIEASKDLMKGRLKDFTEHPMEGLRFYGNKQVSQWNDPTFQMPYYTIDVVDVEASRHGKLLLNLNFWWDSCFHKLLLITASIALVYLCRKRQFSWHAGLPLIVILGYFLFSMLWEAKSRYILLVFPLILPYAGAGLIWLKDWLRQNKLYKFIKNEIDAFWGVKAGWKTRKLNRDKAPIKLYWFRDEKQQIYNFGDELSAELIWEIFGRKVKYTKIDDAEMLAVGSNLDFAENMTLKDNPKVVWGSGFIQAKGSTKKLKHYTYAAVRGAETAKRLGLADITLGDPGILASVIYPCADEVTKKIGLVPHYVDMNTPEVEKLKQDSRFMVIDPMWPPKKVAEAISGCRGVVSSSLHGLIFADSFKVPNIHVQFSDKVLGGEYKFRDYCSGVGKEYRKIETKDLWNTEKLEKALQDYKPIRGLRKLQKNLVQSFPE